jgi:hypothetical protein
VVVPKARRMVATEAGAVVAAAAVGRNLGCLFPVVHSSRCAQAVVAPETPEEVTVHRSSGSAVQVVLVLPLVVAVTMKEPATPKVADRRLWS